MVKKENYLYLFIITIKMPKIKINNLLKFYTLSLLSAGPKHGYDLIKNLEEKLGRKVSASNMYPFLSSLRRNKFIKFDKVGKRDKKTYYLTSDGKNFTKQMFNKFGDLIDIAMEPKLTICQCGCKIYSGEYLEKIKGRYMKFCCSHCANNYNKCN